MAFRLRRSEPRCAPATRRPPSASRWASTPPHILVTTPESLFILLTAEKSREMLRTTRTVIVDEIHAVADDKRGSHLALSLARLDALAGRRKLRSASAYRPPSSRSKKVAEFLSPEHAHRQHRPSARDGSGGGSAAATNWAPWRATRCGPRSTTASRDTDPHPPHHAGIRQHAPACRSAWRMRWRSGWAKTWCCRITAAFRARCGWMRKRG